MERIYMEENRTESSFRRLWEIDTIRGIAVILMVAYHLVWDLAFFGVYAGTMHATAWQVFARCVGTTFIFLLGVSLTLRYSRLEPVLTGRRLFGKFLLRGAMIFGWGLVITLVTYFAIGSGFIVFGILHLLGLSTVLAYPFLRSRWAGLVGGLVVILLGVFLNLQLSPSPWLIWLGVRQLGRHMVDYYPIFPWFGPALLGVFAGFTLYPGGKSRFTLPDLSGAAPVRALSFLGRHSLAIYLVHQPVMLALLILLGIGSI